MEKFDELLSKIGGSGKYQKIVTVLFFFIGLCIDFIIILLSFSLTPPSISFKDNKLNSEITKPLTNDYCYVYEGNIPFSLNKNYDSFNNYFQLYCDKTKSFLILFFLFFGYFIGTIFLFLIGKSRKDIILKLFCIIFSLCTLLIFIQNIWAIYVMIFFHSFCQVIIFLTKLSILNEIIEIEKREYYIFSQLISGVIIGFFIPFLFNLILTYSKLQILYLIFSGINLFFGIILCYFLKSSPKQEIISGNIQSAINSSINIAQINNKIVTEEDKLIISYENQQNQFKIGRERISENELSNWIKLNFNGKFCENDIYYEEIVNNDEDESKSNSDEVLSSEIIYSNSPNEVEEKIIKKNYFFILIIMIGFKILLYINVYEVIYYIYEENFKMSFCFSMFISLFLHLFYFKIKKSDYIKRIILILSFIICMILRILMIFSIGGGAINYTIQRALITTSQIILNEILSSHFNRIDYQKTYFFIISTSQGLSIIVSIIFAVGLIEHVHILYVSLTGVCALFLLFINDSFIKVKL